MKADVCDKKSPSEDRNVPDLDAGDYPAISSLYRESLSVSSKHLERERSSPWEALTLHFLCTINAPCFLYAPLIFKCPISYHAYDTHMHKSTRLDIANIYCLIHAAAGRRFAREPLPYCPRPTRSITEWVPVYLCHLKSIANKVCRSWCKMPGSLATNGRPTPGLRHSQGLRTTREYCLASYHQ